MQQQNFHKSFNFNMHINYFGLFIGEKNVFSI